MSPGHPIEEIADQPASGSEPDPRDLVEDLAHSVLRLTEGVASLVTQVVSDSWRVSARWQVLHLAMTTALIRTGLSWLVPREQESGER